MPNQANIAEIYANSDGLGLAALISGGELSASEVLEHAIETIERRNPEINAVVLKTYDAARKMVTRLPSRAPFAGVPFLLKDMDSFWEGTPLTYGLDYLENFFCPADSELVRRIKNAGFVLLGRSNVPEGGWCIGTESRRYGAAINPLNPAVTPGGSSGGAAAAVASGMVPLAEATDAAGSIRVPASCCGLIGLKPSRGRTTNAPFSVESLFGGATSFCVTKSVRDAAAYLDAIACNLPGDPYTPPSHGAPWLQSLDRPPGRLRIGLAVDAPWGPETDREVVAAVNALAAVLSEQGHTVEPYRIKTDLRKAWSDYNVITAAFFAQTFAKLAVAIGRPVNEHDLAPTNWAIVERGRKMSALDLFAAFEAVRDANRSIAGEFDQFDVLLSPTLTQKPRPAGYWNLEERNLDLFEDLWSDAAYAFPCNVAGLPAISIPAGAFSDGTPIGLHLAGRFGDEETLLRLARQIEVSNLLEPTRPGSGRQ